MASAGARYHQALTALMDRISSEETGSIERAAELVAQTVVEDRLLFAIGTGGHAVMGAEELFYRAGGLASVSAVMDPGFFLGHGAVRSTRVERIPGYARSILRDYGIRSGDVLVIVNAYGINSATVDAALWCREMGVRSIAVTSVQLQRELPLDHPSRHPSQQNVCDIADVVIDNKIPMGDALVEVPGVTQRMGPSSTFANALCLHLMVLRAAEMLIARGIEPPIWQSANSPGGDEANVGILQRYKGRVRNL
jgi:uncharacterized phosphosugar-binding protein